MAPRIKLGDNMLANTWLILSVKIITMLQL